MFIAVVGIAAGPSFIAGFKEVGVSLFIVGALATAIPLLAGLLMARYLFKFHPALSLGCTAGARTTGCSGKRHTGIRIYGDVCSRQYAPDYLGSCHRTTYVKLYK